ncbi:MAG: hypothetical protein FJ088_07180, partial [Deltaproteobacteria bacterium]|nr:hypothetical protein [Deltaproteobacteria bacterium]
GEISADLEVDLPYDLKVYANYSLSRPDARIPKTSIFSIFTDGKYQSFGGELGYFSEGLLSARLGGRYLVFDGGGSGYELKFKPVISSGRVDADMAGIEVGRLKEDDNGYTSLRFFGSYRIEKLTATLDANNYFYDEKVSGYSRSHIVTLTFGYDIFENALIQGDIVATVNPEFDQEWAGLLKFNYFFNSFAR